MTRICVAAALLLAVWAQPLGAQSGSAQSGAAQAGSSQSGTVPSGAAVDDPACVVKGNVNPEKKTRIYHTVDSPFYGRTVIKPDEGDACFATVEEAENAGFRAARSGAAATEEDAAAPRR